VVKLDPARSLPERRLREVLEWAPDAVVVGGTGGYGRREVVDLLARLRPADVPVALEVADTETLCPGFDLYFVPMVLNSREVEWVIGRHQKAVKRFAPVAEWDRLVTEGYCILNPDATAASVADARCDLGSEDVVAFALLAEHVLKLPIFYLEYSGAYGDPQLVGAVAEVLHETRLWYGGGIREGEQMRAMAGPADTVVIGNVVYEEDVPLPDPDPLSRSSTS
jgi:putative glycerol-1-phosphate prenyltransferase